MPNNISNDLSISESYFNVNKLLAIRLLNDFLVERAIIIEGTIILDTIITEILLSCLLGYLRLVRFKDFNEQKMIERFQLRSFIEKEITLYHKLELLRKFKILDNNYYYDKLCEIRDLRNSLAHYLMVPNGIDERGILKKALNHKSGLVELNSTFTDAFKDDYSNCYVYLMYKLEESKLYDINQISEFTSVFEREIGKKKVKKLPFRLSQN